MYPNPSHDRRQRDAAAAAEYEAKLDKEGRADPNNWQRDPALLAQYEAKREQEGRSDLVRVRVS